MTVTTTNYGPIPGFPNGLKKDLDEVFDVHFNKMGDQYKEVFKMEETEDAYEDDIQIQLPDEISAASEGGMYPRVEIENVRAKRYTMSTFKSEIKITREAIEDMKYRKMLDAAEGLGVAMKRTVERKAASFFYNGFSSEQSPDGVSVWNTNHTLSNVLSGAPFTVGSNTLGAVTLNATNLKSALTLMEKQPDEHGSVAPGFADQLIVCPDLRWIGEQLTDPVNGYEPGTGNRDRNVAGGGLKLVVLNFLCEAPLYSTTMWGIRDSRTAKNKFWWRVQPQKEVLIEEATGDYLYRVRFRIDRGCSDWRNMVFNQGA